MNIFKTQQFYYLIGQIEMTDKKLNSSETTGLLSGSKTTRILPSMPEGHARNDSSVDSDKKLRKKKCIRISLAISSALIAIIIIILVVVLKKDDNNPPQPGPDPGPPGPIPPGSNVNPYGLVQDNSYKISLSQVSGHLKANSNQLDYLREKRIIQSQNGDQVNAAGVLDPLNIPSGENNQVVEKIYFELGQSNDLVSYLHLNDESRGRYSIPKQVLAKPVSEWDRRLESVGLTWDLDPFSFKFTDTRNNSNVLLSTESQNLYIMDKYLQVDLKLPSQRVFGLGERSREFMLSQGTWTIWANGKNITYDDGSGGLQSFGVQPFALVQTAIPGQFLGIFFRNSNAQSPVLYYNEDGTSTLSYITTGGAIEVYFFLKGNAKQIIKKYQQTFGTPAHPPLWALGWQVSTRNFRSQEEVESVVASYKEAGIPLEGIWLDIDYLSSDQDFKVNKQAFKDLQSLGQSLKSSNQTLSVTVKASLTTNTSSDYYMQAQEDNSLIKSFIYPDNEFSGALTTQVFANSYHQVFEKDRVFLDFFNNKSVDIWTKGLIDLYSQVPFDGLSLDMNEPTTYCDGECPNGDPKQAHQKERRKLKVKDDNGYIYTSFSDQTQNSTYNLPFIPGKFNLDNMSLSLNGTHPSSNLSEYDVHSLFGHMQAMYTKQVMDQNISELSGKRNFVLTRNTFSTTGRFASHWFGNNKADWSDMKYSISNIMNFNMFGTPLTGPDTCGFYGQTNDTYELCARWIQLASFYPFARWNSEYSFTENHPFNMNETHQMWVKNALNQRLQFARQMYSCLKDIKDNGGTCFDPLFFHFPLEEQTFFIIEDTFIFANALKLSPILSPGVSKGSSLQSYFPKGHWVNMNDYSDIIISEGGPDGWKSIPVDQTENSMIGLHLMPGKWVAKQEGQFMTTSDLTLGEKSNITLIANRDSNGAAYTKIYFDDGIKSDSGSEGLYELLLSSNSIKKWQIIDDEGARGWEHIEAFVITDAEDLNSTNFACVANQDSLYTTLLFTDYDQEKKTLTIYNPNSTIDLHAMKDIYFGDSSKEGSNYVFCQDAISSGSYVVAGDEMPDMSGNNVTFQLVARNKMSRPNLNMTLSLLNGGILNIYYTFADDNIKKPFEVPEDLVKVNRTNLMEGGKLSDYLQVYNQSYFQLGVIKTGQMIFRLEDISLLNHVNNMQFTAFVNDDQISRVMGLFERYNDDMFISSGASSMWNRDAGNPGYTGKLPASNAYSTHPLIAGSAPGGSFYYGVYLNNLAGVDYFTSVDTETEQGKKTLFKTRSNGGLGDIFIVLGDIIATEHSYLNLIKKYQKHIVGLPVMIPQWSLGWHQSKWGYQTTDDIREVVGNFSKYDLPLDVMWNDIDWMDNYRNFQPDPDRFADIKNLTDTLHEKNLHYVPIIDAGLAQREQTEHAYNQYLEGKQKDVFIKNQAGETITGMVWPNDAVFPDFYNPATVDWWKNSLTQMWDQVGFDGLWLDMNEISNFCDGVCYDNQASESPIVYKLPYIPSGRNIQDRAVPLDAVHYGDISELDVHSSFGSLEVKATHDWFKEVQKQRTFIIGRSSSAGIGKYGSMWGGDNNSDEDSWYLSVFEAYQHQVFGIPMFGVDICGFGGDTNPELCARWYQLGAFYPFSRNHNAWNTRSQEPYQFAMDIYEGAISYTDIIRQAMRKKYNMIRYLYTEYSNISKDGGALFMPLWFDWQYGMSSSHVNYSSANDFMLGSALKVSILVGTLNQNTTSFYFPIGTWCSLLNPKLKCDSGDEDRNVDLQSKAYDSYVHLRNGKIIPWQDATSLGINSIYELQQQPIDLIINPACGFPPENICTASGSYVNDDGLVLDRDGYMNNYTFSFRYSPGTNFVLNITSEARATEVKDQRVNQNDRLGTIQVTNAQHLMNLTNLASQMANPVGDTLVAQYAEETDRLVLNFTDVSLQRQLWLPDLDQIIFTVEN